MAEEDKNISTEADDKDSSSTEDASDDKAADTKEDVSSSTEEKKEKEGASSDSDSDVEVPEKFKSLIETIENMSVLDLSELVKILEKKFGVSAAAPVAMVSGASAAGGDEEGTEEKSSFSVELTSAGDNKIGVIKAIREITQVGLKDAKDMADSAPKVIKENVPKEEAEEIKKKIEEAGGSVELK